MVITAGRERLRRERERERGGAVTHGGMGKWTRKVDGEKVDGERERDRERDPTAR